MSRSFRSVLGVGSLALLVAAALAAAPAQAATPAPVQAFLATQVSHLVAGAPTTVLVHGTDAAAARAAVADTGMRRITEFRRIGVVVASGTASQIEAARTEPGVTYLEGNTPIRFFDQTSNVATRGAEAVRTLEGANGQPLDGRGVSVAGLGAGVPPAHPAFRHPARRNAPAGKPNRLPPRAPTTRASLPV